MPILPQEVCHYPLDLFDDETCQDSRRWWVLHTKPRQEKVLARHLTQLGISFYLPLQERRSVIRGRVTKSYNPLFPSYVFLRGDVDERVAALSTNQVVRTLEVYDQQEMQRDLTQLYLLIRSGLPIDPVRQLKAGVMVEIISGPLAGMRGPILREVSGTRFVVQVNFIQQGASVMLEDFMLSVIPN